MRMARMSEDSPFCGKLLEGWEDGVRRMLPWDGKR